MSQFVRLNFAGFRILVPDDADGFARAFAGARVGRSALTAHRQSAAVPDAAITIDRLQPFQIALQLAPEIAFDRQFARGNCVDDMIELFRGQIFRANIGIDVRLFEDLFRSARTDAINVRQGRFDPFISGNFNSK